MSRTTTHNKTIYNKKVAKKHFFVQSLFGIVLALLNHGCTTVGPEYKRPDMTVPDHYKEVEKKQPAQTSLNNLKSAENTAYLSHNWWQVYNDDRLNDLLAQIEVNNYALQGVAARVKQAKALFEESKAYQSPAVVAGGRNDFGLIVNWEVDLWGRIQREVEASGAAAQASIADYAAAKLSLQTQLAQNYFLLRVKDADIALLQSTLTSYEKSLQITKNKYAMGLVGRIDVAQAQAQLSSTQVQQFNVEVSRAQLEHAIALLMGKTPVGFSIRATTSQFTMPTIPDDLPANLLAHRPDIAAAERRVAAASANIGVAEAAAYPALDLFAGASISKGLIGGFDLEAPIYTAGATTAIRTKAEAVYQEEVANYQQTIVNAFREVEDNLATLRILSQAAKSQNEAVEASRETVEISNNKYQAGIIDHQSIIIEQAFALNNERGTLSILARRLVASVNLIKALGGGWQADALITTESLTKKE